MTNMAGVPIEQFCPVCGKCDNWETVRRTIAEEVRNSAYHIIDYKGATNFAVGLALTRITEAILRNQNSVFTVSAVLEGEYGLSGLSLGVPCILSQKGVERILQVNLPPEEQNALAKSAAILKELIAQLELPGPG
jgi:L-lactate dehydrogenase